MLIRLGLVEQRHKAVLEVLGGATVTDVALWGVGNALADSNRCLEIGQFFGRNRTSYPKCRSVLSMGQATCLRSAMSTILPKRTSPRLAVSIHGRQADNPGVARAAPG